jgi:hypothetical protein
MAHVMTPSVYRGGATKDRATRHREQQQKFPERYIIHLIVSIVATFQGGFCRGRVESRWPSGGLIQINSFRRLGVAALYVEGQPLTWIKGGWSLMVLA